MKRLISYLLAFITILLFTSSISIAQQSVANIPITVKLQAGNVFIAQCVTNAAGEFTFDFQQDFPVPKKGTFIFEITPPPSTSVENDTSKFKHELAHTVQQRTQKLIIDFTAKTPRPFTYILKWVQSKSNRGGFAISGRNMS